MLRKGRSLCVRGLGGALLLGSLLTAPAHAKPAPGHAGNAGDAGSVGNLDIRVGNAKQLLSVLTGNGIGRQQAAARAGQLVTSLRQGAQGLAAASPSAEVRFSPLTSSAEVVRNPRGGLTAAVPGRDATATVLAFLHANKSLYGLSDAEIDALHIKGESLSRRNGLRMVRLDQVVNGMPVFQSDTRFLLDKSGRLVRSVGLLAPQATAYAPFPVIKVPAEQALAAAMKTVGIDLDASKIHIASDVSPGHKGALTTGDARVPGSVSTQLVYFPLAPGVLVPAWMQVSFTHAKESPGDWTTLVDAASGKLLWRKNIRSYASTQQARFDVYVQADGTTPANSPAPHSPTAVTPGSGTQFPGIARTTVSMLTAQSTTASPDGWIPDGGSTTTGNNVDAYLDTDGDNAPDAGLLDNNGRPVGNLDGGGNNRDFLGTGYNYTPPPLAGNPDAGDGPGNTQEQRGAVTHLFYLANWYHDQLYSYGFDEAAGNFQSNNFGNGGTGGDPVLAEAQDGSGTDNANFSTPPDGTSGRMQMFVFDFPTPNRDGSLDADVVLHELTHGLSNRLIGDGNGLIWDIGGGMGEGWSDFYSLSLINSTNAHDPNAEYATGAYATYQLGGLTDNYLYGIRRFPYSTDNTVNPLTWADVDDVTVNLSGGIAPSPLGFEFNGALEVHNIGEIWALTLWEVRSRVIADPAGANGDVPTGNATMLQLVTDALKMTPINPSFTDARDALIDADCATNACANEASIWAGFADRGLGFKAVAPLGQVGVLGLGAQVGIGESFKVPYLDVQSVAVDYSGGNNNGAIDPGEPVRLTVTLVNPWRNAAKGVPSVAATLTTSTPGVTIYDNTSTYGAIAAQGTAAGDPFLITVPANITCGRSIHFTLTTVSSLGTTSTDFVIRVGVVNGVEPPVLYTRTILGGLPIPDSDFTGVTDTLTITDDREIAGLDFHIDNLAHTYTGDLTVALKAPNGYGTDMVYLRGFFLGLGAGDGDNFINTTFTDDATSDLNLTVPTDAPFSGDWEPAFNGDIWSLFGIPNLGPDPVNQLSRVNGLSTQGDWKIHVTDEAEVDTGALNTWSLVVTPWSYFCVTFSPASSVGATKTVSGTFAPGGTVTYTVTLTNTGTAGQTDNPGNEFTDVLPPSLTLVSATATSGAAAATIASNTVTWNGAIAPLGGTVTITITATVNAGTNGQIVSNQGTTSLDSNNDGTNDTAGVTDDPGTATANDPTVFTVGGAHVTGTKVVATFTTSTVTYTIVLTNSGGPQADNPGPEFTDALPPQLTLVSATASSGVAMATVPTNTVTWNGALGTGASVTITITATINPGGLGTPISNQGTILYDSDGNGTNDASGVTDDPTTAAPGDPTTFSLITDPGSPIPTLSEIGLAALALLLAVAALSGLRRRRTA